VVLARRRAVISPTTRTSSGTREWEDAESAKMTSTPLDPSEQLADALLGDGELELALDAVRRGADVRRMKGIEGDVAPLSHASVR
jgi:hypothetical protein